MKKLLLLFLIMGNAFAQIQTTPTTSYATAQADNIQAIMDQQITLTSEHFAFVYNNSYGQALFSYYFQLCAALQGCTIKSFTVSLNPHTAINVYYSLVLQALYTTAGLYTITATTGIVGPNTNVLVSNLNSANIINPNNPNLPAPF